MRRDYLQNLYSASSPVTCILDFAPLDCLPSVLPPSHQYCLFTSLPWLPRWTLASLGSHVEACRQWSVHRHRSTAVETPVSDQSPPLPPTRDADGRPHDIVTDCVDCSASSTCVHWQTKSTICSSCKRDRHIDVMCLAETWHDMDSVVFDVCAPSVTKWSIVHARDHRQSFRRCRPTITEWQLYPRVRRSSVVHRSRR